MIAQDLYTLLRRRPFVPFLIHATDGRVREVRHPDGAMVFRTHVILPIDNGSEVPEASEFLALGHIVRFETNGPVGAGA